VNRSSSNSFSSRVTCTSVEAFSDERKPSYSESWEFGRSTYLWPHVYSIIPRRTRVQLQEMWTVWSWRLSLLSRPSGNSFPDPSAVREQGSRFWRQNRIRFILDGRSVCVFCDEPFLSLHFEPDIWSGFDKWNAIEIQTSFTSLRAKTTFPGLLIGRTSRFSTRDCHEQVLVLFRHPLATAAVFGGWQAGNQNKRGIDDEKIILTTLLIGQQRKGSYTSNYWLWTISHLSRIDSKSQICVACSWSTLMVSSETKFALF
jgi:hypothetical protein